MMLETKEPRACDRCGHKFKVLHKYGGFSLCYRCIEIARYMELAGDSTNHAFLIWREWEEELDDAKYSFTG